MAKANKPTGFGEIDLTEIIVPENLQRTAVDDAKIASLAASIERVGLINRVVVRPTKQGLELVAGYRRYLAFVRLKRATIPARVLGAGDGAIEQITLDENLERDDVNVVDEALWLGRMKEKESLTADALARKVGKSAAWIAGRLAVLEWPEPVLEGLAAGRFSLAVARELAKCTDEDEIARLSALITENGATASVVKYWVSMAENARKFAASDETDAGETVADVTEYTPPPQFCDVCEQPTSYMESKLVRMCPRCYSIARANLKGGAHE